MKRGDDGLWFIDYLGAILYELEEPSSEYPAFLGQHRQIILDGQAVAARSSKVLHKYLWLASYHNQACADLKDTELAAQLAISKTDFAWIEEFPEVSLSIKD